MENKETTNISVIARNWLVKKGYQVQSQTSQTAGWSDEINILTKDEPKKLFGIFRLRQKHIVMATIWFRNCEGCNHDNWVIEVRGIKHLVSAKKIAREMLHEFKQAAITVRLISPE